MIPTFPTQYNAIEERIHSMDAVSYAKTRNFLNGSVSYLSPYIARGVISLPQIKDIILQQHSKYEAEKLIQELAWREYYQRVWQVKGNQIFTDLKQTQERVAHYGISSAIENATTGITSIDNAIQQLYETGYMHNHARMYTAMLTCNIAQAHWLAPAKWMYYHLLDGDLASNMLSWQWVAGSFSSKKYVANQENINKYTNSNQHQTYIDLDYAALPNIAIPAELEAYHIPNLKTNLPESNSPIIGAGEKVFVYNSYNIDPHWHSGEEGKRILLLEPSQFEAFPVSEKVLSFIIALAKNNIPNIQIWVAEFDDLLQKTSDINIFYKEHPLTLHYQGHCDQRNWMFPEITGYYPSFFGFWKKTAKYF